MVRYEVLHEYKNYSIECNREQQTYTIFYNTGMFKQQISKNYRYFRCCVKKFIKIAYKKGDN